jgi:mannose/fructose/N-acetylgalactosamine-specific phosphotransferase system component IID
LPAIEPQKHQFSARTSLLALVMKLLESMESEERPNGGFYKSQINNIKLAAFKQCIPYNCLSAFKMQMQK